MNQNKNALGHFLALITILIWGTTFISTKILLREFTAVEILFYRFVLGYSALFLIYPHRLKLKSRKHELIIACAGLCGVTLYYLLENIALTFSMVSNVSVIVSVAPLFTAILASRFLEKEALKLNFLIGFVTAITGICFISYSKSASFQVNPVGDLLALLAAIVWAVYSILSKKIGSYGYNTIQTTRRIFFYGLLFMTPALFIYDFKLELIRFTEPVYLFNILFLGLGACALCFVTWNSAVIILGAVKTSIYIYLVPVITVVTSVLVLKDVITSSTAIGTILTMTGLFISKSRIGLKKEKAVSEKIDIRNIE